MSNWMERAQFNFVVDDAGVKGSSGLKKRSCSMWKTPIKRTKTLWWLRLDLKTGVLLMLLYP